MFTGTYPADRRPEGYRQQTVSTTAVSLTNVPQSATSAIVFVETQGIRCRDDSVAPTSGVGFPLAALASFELNSRKAINQFKMIRSGASDAVVSIAYYSAGKAY